MFVQTFGPDGLPANKADVQPVGAFNRAQWLEDRKMAIGASDVAAILGISPFSSPWEVFAEKTDRLEPWNGNESTQAGISLEPVVLNAAEMELGELRRNVRLVHPSLPMAATLDAQTVASGLPVEAKTTGIVGPTYGEWGDALTDQVPDYYLVQVHAQLLVTGADLGYLFALIGGRGLVRYEIQRDERFSQWLGNYCNDWWNRHVIADSPPEFVNPELSVVKRLKKKPGKVVELGEDIAALCEKWQAAAANKAASEKEANRLQAHILLAMGDATEAVLPGASIVNKKIDVKAQTRDAYSYYRVYYKKDKE